MKICHAIQNDVIHLHRNRKWKALCGNQILAFWKSPDECLSIGKHLKLLRERMTRRPDSKKLCDDCVKVARMIRDLEKQEVSKDAIKAFMFEIEGIK